MIMPKRGNTCGHKLKKKNLNNFKRKLSRFWDVGFVDIPGKEETEAFTKLRGRNTASNGRDKGLDKPVSGRPS